MSLKAITTCVEFGDLLALTLPHALKHVDEIMVITSPNDDETQELCRMDDRVRLHVTDAFYRNGAEFNKGLAMEEGFDLLGREGRILVLDADIVIPQDADLSRIEPNRLYGARRRQCSNPAAWNGAFDWGQYERVADGEIAGYFQLFHGESVQLEKRPWYPTDFRTAATVDQMFTWRWGPSQEWLPFDVLHLGMMSNWTGRRSVRVDGTMPAQAKERTESLDRIVEARMRGCGMEAERLTRP